ncbi:hypothetical protein MMC07_008097 [Pseudocyphellaria aurata]|nr:hypothetical protein [Pseudocyphellaria aurata]
MDHSTGPSVLTESLPVHSHTAEEAVDASSIPSDTRAPGGKRVVESSSRVLRVNPTKTAKARGAATTIAYNPINVPNTTVAPTAFTSINVPTTTVTTTTAGPSRRSTKRKPEDMAGPSTKKARVIPDVAATATKTLTKGAAKAKASAKGGAAKVPNAKRASVRAPKGKGNKRAHDDNDDDDEGTGPPPPKKARELKSANKAKPKVVINEAPTKRLDVFVYGEGSSGELGLGVARNAIDVKRPRLNPLLSASEVGVVHVAAGGMHAAAITHDGLIFTWGVNDQGALGRDTTWDGGMRDIDGSDDDDQDSNGLNPRESTPTAISRESFPPGVVFVQLACGDSNTFALTDDGDVYGWGTFRDNNGVLGFSKDVKAQATPVKLPGLQKIKQIACGANHCLALRENGDVYVWGSGEQNQLGYRVIERKRYDALTPSLLRLRKKCRLIGCGLDHSFAVQRNDTVWTWGLNSFGEAGIREGAGGDSAVVFSPSPVPDLALTNDSIAVITGGAHHSIATTTNGELLIWGRIDGNQMGLDITSLPDTSLIKDVSDKARILICPTRVPAGTIGTAAMATAGTDHSLCINQDGEAFSWGFNVNYQCGQGSMDEITRPTRIENTAVRDRFLNWAGAGGQFSILTSVAESEEEKDEEEEL